jgi:hypothetical protein
MKKFLTVNMDTQTLRLEKTELDENSNEVMTLSFEAEEVGDEYHTMHELYQHRMALNIALFHVLENTTDNHDFRVYKSERHHPDSDPMFEGYFIVFCFDTRNGNWTSYHYKQKHWDEFDIPTASHPPLYPKGHVSAIEFLSGMFKS